MARSHWAGLADLAGFAPAKTQKNQQNLTNISQGVALGLAETRGAARLLTITIAEVGSLASYELPDWQALKV